MSVATEALVALERRGAVTVLTLANPPAGALSQALVTELGDALGVVALDDPAVVVIRSAVPDYFGAGADLRLLETVNVGGFIDYLDRVRGAIEALAGLGAISVAAIDGQALGGGLELALACTFRVAGPGARLGLPEVKLGLLPGAGGTQRLTRLAGRDAALQLMLSGRTVGAAEAAALGLISRVAAESAEAEALEWAELLAAMPVEAMRAIVRCVDAAAPDRDAGGMETEANEIYRLFRSDDATAAIAGFVARTRRA